MPLIARRTRDLAPFSWFAAATSTGATLSAVALLALLPTPIVGFGVQHALSVAFASPREAILVLASTAVLALSSAVALRQIVLMPVLTERHVVTEARMRGNSARVVLASSGGAVALVLAWAVGRVGGAAWESATVLARDGAAAPEQAVVGAILLCCAVVAVAGALASWIAAVALAARLLLPRRARTAA